MKNLKLLILIMAVACTLIFASCAPKNPPAAPPAASPESVSEKSPTPSDDGTMGIMPVPGETMIEASPTPTQAESPKAPEIKPSPEKTANLTKEAEKCLEEGNYECAMTNLNKTITADDKNAQAHALRGRAYFEMQKYEEASADIEKALKLNPDNAYAYYCRGILRAKDMEPGAVEDFDKSLKLDPKNADAFYRRGLLHKDAGNRDKAKVDFEEALKLDPKGETGELARESLDDLKNKTGR